MGLLIIGVFNPGSRGPHIASLKPRYYDYVWREGDLTPTALLAVLSSAPIRSDLPRRGRSAGSSVDFPEGGHGSRGLAQRGVETGDSVSQLLMFSPDPMEGVLTVV